MRKKRRICWWVVLGGVIHLKPPVIKAILPIFDMAGMFR